MMNKTTVMAKRSLCFLMVTFFLLSGCADDSQQGSVEGEGGGMVSLNLVSAADSDKFYIEIRRNGAWVTDLTVSKKGDKKEANLDVPFNQEGGTYTYTVAVYGLDGNDQILSRGEAEVKISKEIPEATVDITLSNYIPTPVAGLEDQTFNPKSIKLAWNDVNYISKKTGSQPADNPVSEYKVYISDNGDALPGIDPGELVEIKSVKNPDVVDISGYQFMIANAPTTIYWFVAATDNGIKNPDANKKPKPKYSKATITLNKETEELRPQVEITSPIADSYSQGQDITFSGSGTDSLGNSLNAGSLKWKSDKDGDIGTDTSFTINDLSVDQHTITLTVTDLYGKTNSDDIMITINPNQRPTATIISPSKDSTFDFGESITFSGAGTDPEDGTLLGTSLVWTDVMSGQLPIQLGNDNSLLDVDNLAVGQHTITLTVTDSSGEPGSANISITIEDVDKSPTAKINQPSGGEFEAGLDIPFAGEGLDYRGMPITGDDYLVWTSSLDGEIGTGTEFSKKDLSEGEHTITLTVTDLDNGETITAETQIEITPKENRPEVAITSPADGNSFPVRKEITFTGTGIADYGPTPGPLPDGSLVWTSNRDGEIDKGKTIFISTLSEGIHKITLTATDSNKTSNSYSITIKVTNDPPEARITSPSPEDTIYFQGEDIPFSCTATDQEDGENLIYLWESDIDLVIGNFQSITKELSEGEHEITLTVTDTDGQAGTDTLILTIHPDTDKDMLSDTWEEHYARIVDPLESENLLNIFGFKDYDKDHWSDRQEHDKDILDSGSSDPTDAASPGGCPDEPWFVSDRSSVFQGDTVTINGVPAERKDKVLFYDPDEVLCGVGMVNNSGGYGQVKVYGDDLNTDNTDEGARSGDQLKIIVWDASADEFYTVDEEADWESKLVNIYEEITGTVIQWAKDKSCWLNFTLND